MNRHTLKTAGAFILTSGLACAAAQAQDATYTNATGDTSWYNPLNWDTGAVPVGFDDALITGSKHVQAFSADGGDITIGNFELGYDAPGFSRFNGTVGLQVFRFGVGITTSNSGTPGAPSGSFSLRGADLTGTVGDGASNMNIGSAADSSGSNGSPPAQGQVFIEDGSVLGFDRIEIGRSFSQGGFAEGLLLVRNGDIIRPDSNTGRILLGSAEETTDAAVGALVIENGSLRGFDSIRVGQAAGPTDNAAGVLSLFASSATFAETDPTTLSEPGLYFAVGENAQAKFYLDQSYFSSGAQPVIINENTFIEVTASGPTRAADGVVGLGTYSAMDLASAEINGGGLILAFSETPPLSGDSYDLIRLRSGAFTGPGFSEIEVDYPATFATEIVPATPTTGEVFRLTILSTCIADVTSTNTNPGDEEYGEPDGVIDGADLSFYVEAWLAGDASVADVTTTNTNPGDTNYGRPDGTVDGADLSFYVEQWLSGCV